MAVIVQTTSVKGLGSNGPSNLTRTTLTAADTLTHVRGSNQSVHLYNTTASPVVVTFAGTAPTTLNPDGYGGTISTAGGKAITVPANGWTVIELDDMWAYLTGTGVVNVTGGTGVTAVLFN